MGHAWTSFQQLCASAAYQAGSDALLEGYGPGYGAPPPIIRSGLGLDLCRRCHRLPHRCFDAKIQHSAAHLHMRNVCSRSAAVARSVGNLRRSSPAKHRTIFIHKTIAVSEERRHLICLRSFLKAVFRRCPLGTQASQVTTLFRPRFAGLCVDSMTYTNPRRGRWKKHRQGHLTL